MPETVARIVRVTPCPKCGAYLPPGTPRSLASPCAMILPPGTANTRYERLGETGKWALTFRIAPKGEETGQAVIASEIPASCIAAQLLPPIRLGWKADPAAETVEIDVEVEVPAPAPVTASPASIEGPAPSAAAAPAPPASFGRPVIVRGRSYLLAPEDALTLFGALAMAVDGQTAEIKLASGAILTLSHEDISSLGPQLAGKPADEVS